MLTEAQKNYLLTIPEETTVTIKPFSEEIEQAAADIVQAAQAAVSGLEVRHMGASALGISGQGDLDIYVYCKPAEFDTYLPSLVEVFGEPAKRGETSIKWAFEKNGFPVELYLTDPTTPAMQEQIKIFELLRDNQALCGEYEKLKASMNGRSFREYQTAKYGFYNRLLGYA